MAVTRPGTGKQTGGLLSVEQFISLAGRCRLMVSSVMLNALSARDLLAPVGQHNTPYAPAHLWIVARYLEAVTIHHHPWSTPKTIEQALLDALPADAQVLNSVLHDFYLSDQPPAQMSHAQNALVEQMGRFIQERDPLGAFSHLLPYLRPELRSQMRGDALIVGLLRELLARVWHHTSSETALHALGGAS
ncbi:MAG: hypothetical protein AAFS10_11075, partial [Myxococcota bacterium]